ncbi:MAG: hypothetical protein N2043_09990 [Ignavibacterium sp.]|nr:hypothetical protein [Ignavibacterium sp.]
MNKDLITALVDNEIKDENIQKELNELISSDSQFRYEYDVQSLCKKLVREKVKKVKAPEYLREKILSEIKPKETIAIKKHNFLLNIFYKPAFTFATALVIIISIILIVVNRFDNSKPPEIDFSKLDSDNMLLQAVNNYNLILNGKLAPQYVSDNSKEICNFFSKNGVHYSTIVPEFKEWKLLGAVVSEDKGIKLAHHVYAGKNNQIIYVFQVDKDYVNKVIKIDSDLLEYIESGNCYSKEYSNNLIILTEIDHNIFAIIANDDFNYVKNNFCSLN